MRLAQAEMTEKGKRAGLGIGMFGGAGVVALYGVGTLIATVILLLALAMDAWVAALIVTVGLFVVAGDPGPARQEAGEPGDPGRAREGGRGRSRKTSRP